MPFTQRFLQWVRVIVTLDPPIKPIVEEEKETTTGGTDLTGTDLDVDIAEPKTKFVNEDGSTFNPEAAPVDTNPFDKATSQTRQVNSQG